MGFDPSILSMLGGLGGGGKAGGPDLSQLANLASLAGSMKPPGHRAARAATPEGDPIIDVDEPGGKTSSPLSGLDMGTLMSVLSMVGNMAPEPQPPPEPEPQPQDPCRGCREFCPRSGLALPEYEEARRRAEICCRF